MLAYEGTISYREGDEPLLNHIKAFNTVACGLLKVMSSLGYPSKFLAILRQLHDRPYHGFDAILTGRQTGLK